MLHRGFEAGMWQSSAAPPPAGGAYCDRVATIMGDDSDIVVCWSPTTTGGENGATLNGVSIVADASSSVGYSAQLDSAGGSIIFPDGPALASLKLGDVIFAQMRLYLPSVPTVFNYMLGDQNNGSDPGFAIRNGSSGQRDTFWANYYDGTLLHHESDYAASKWVAGSVLYSVHKETIYENVRYYKNGQLADSVRTYNPYNRSVPIGKSFQAFVRKGGSGPLEVGARISDVIILATDPSTTQLQQLMAL